MREKVIILSSEIAASFVVRLDNLYEQVRVEMDRLGSNEDNLIWSRVYLSDAANQLPHLLEHSLYRDVLSSGAFSYVEQPPLSTCKVSALLVFADSEVAIEKHGDASARIIKQGGARYLFQSVRFTAEEAGRMTVKEQTMEAFRRHIQWLRQEGLNLRDHCMRTWLFVRDIDHNYHDVVEGRNDIFCQEGLTYDTHYIASTGIGGNGNNGRAAVCVDFLSIDDASMKVTYLQALDYLNPTHDYGVAFERGVALTQGDVRHLLISGTASIDCEGNCLYEGEVLQQTERLFLNIDHLLADGGASLNDVSYFIVYLRDLSDYVAVNDYMVRRFPHKPVLITLAPVCRPKWLIEVECVATRFLN